MVSINAVSTRQSEASISLRVFTRGIRITWLAIAAITILLEIIPIPLMAPLRFYAYCGGKALLFALLGYMAPLAFWRFNELNRGIAFAAFSACLVETLQGVLHHGHSFHWYELLIKLAIILVGFSLALNARYDRQIAIGPLRIRLVEDHT
jgi:glycopeptide antibiotics resistance protein